MTAAAVGSQDSGCCSRVGTVAAAATVAMAAAAAAAVFIN